MPSGFFLTAIQLWSILLPVSDELSEPENQLLAALPESEYQRLIPHLEYVSLTLGQVIYEPDEPIQSVYFPNGGIISLVSLMENGSTTEIGIVGREGMVGLPVVLGGDRTNNTATVQIAADAMKMSAEVLKSEFDRGGKLQKLLLIYIQALFTQVSQTAVCNRHHPIEQRLARWLLTVQDYIGSNKLPLTQEFLANMLGTYRPSITVPASVLQQAGIIRYSRGKISILNREDLEATACECYRIVRDENLRLLGSKQG